MVDRQYWIQLENRPWDVSPWNIDRMTGSKIIDRDNINPVTVTLNSPGSGVSRTVTMFKSFKMKSDGKTPEDALILRRYWGPGEKDGNGKVVTNQAWTVPRDNKINPWDLNEQDPTDTGTMGTIPGPILECLVGDRIIVNFRNNDNRTQVVQKTITLRSPVFIGGRITWVTRTLTIYVNELLPVEQRTHSLHPHGITFDPRYDGAYPLTPQDASQPVAGPPDETALWSSLSVANSKQGDRVPSGATFTYTWDTISWPATAGVWLYHDHSICDSVNVSLGAIGILVVHNPNDPQDVLPPNLWNDAAAAIAPNIPPARKSDLPGGTPNGPAIVGGQYQPPQNAAQYLQLYHSLGDADVCINGRVYLGNTPTMLASPTTVMRFGVVGMGDNFHTFHIHGHRWFIPGPDGNTPLAIQGNIQNKSASQFEDTRIFGPANSFSFTIDEGNGFFRAPNPIGEWHMHCHVLSHMMMGMMGSLLVAAPNQAVKSLPQGMMCPAGMMQMQAGQVTIVDNAFQPANISIKAGQKVTWVYSNAGTAQHTVTSNPGPSGCSPPSSENFSSQALKPGDMFEYVFNTPGTYAYHCEIHGCMMSGTVTVN